MQAAAGVRRAFAVGLVLTVVGVLQAALVPAAQAAVTGWDVEEVTGTFALSSATTNVVTLDCPGGYVPLSGGVYRTNGDPALLSLQVEQVASTSAVSTGSDYRAVVRLQADSAVEVSARLACARTDSPLAITAVHGVLSTQETGSGLAVAGTIGCPAGSSALNASVDPTATVDDVSEGWLVHSSPSYDGQGWHAMAAATINRLYVVDVPIVVHCLAGNDLPGATIQHTIQSVGVEPTFLEQACPSDTTALAGGAFGAVNETTTPDRTVETVRISQWHPASGLTARRAATFRFSDAHARVVSVALCWRVPSPSTLTLGSKPPALSTSRGATFGFTTSAPATVHCRLDAATEQPCTSPVSYARLADGAHVWRWRTVNAGGDQASGSYTWKVDTTRPTAAMTSPGNGFILTNSTPVGWTGSDLTAGLATFDLYTRIGPYDYGFVQAPAPQTFPAAQRSTTVGGLATGTSYCFSVVARDKAGWRSARSAERCTTTPADDRALTASAGWTRRTGTGLYGGTETVATATGATLRLANARVSRIGLVVTRCPGCGSVAVYAGSTLVGNVSLAASTVQHKQVVLLPRISSRIATVSVKVLSAAKPVRIDGLGVIRS